MPGFLFFWIFASYRISGGKNMFKIIIKPILAFLFVLVLIYVTLCLVETTQLPLHARINSIDCSEMTADQAAEKIAKEYKFEETSVLKDENKIGEILPVYNIDKESLKNDISKIIGKYHINPILWYKLSNNYKMRVPVLDNKKRENMIKKLKKIDGNHYTVKTQNAYLDYANLKIVKEVNGDNINFEKLEKSFRNTVSDNSHVFLYETKKFLQKPSVKSDDEGLKSELKFCKKYIKGGLNVTANNKNINIPNVKLRQIIIPGSEDDPAVVSSDGAKEVVKWISQKYKFAEKITVKLHGKDLTLNDLGGLTSVDTEKTSESIKSAAEQKIKGNNQNAEVFFTHGKIDYTKNYIEVSINKQKLYYYKNGKLKMSCNVVTGRPSHFTPKGAFSIMWKERNTVLRGFEDNGKKYESPVSYWMPLTDMGVGLHDASWRGSFGGDIYKYNGSHGCVNMPSDRAAWLYNHVPEKYPVFIY